MKRNWILKGIFLGSVFFLSILLIRPIGISTQFSVVSGMIQRIFQDDIIYKDGNNIYSLIDYYNQEGIARNIISPYNYGIIFVVGIFFGGMLGRIFFRKKDEFIEKEKILKNDKISKFKLFLGGVILLFGARMAGGCTSGHMMSGIMQLSVSSIIFTIVLFPIAIIIAKRMGE